ncbi:hypothetical protein ECBCE008MS01_2320 [Escherichia coli BCE008_MS-01]|nr:hypothetical protein ECMP02101710_2552 [Escherichia coli MP021017.10]ENB16030.1 hypothetical protein ECBCE008MS01_2320 [Escherichia coli BCE008_MS-01]
MPDVAYADKTRQRRIRQPARALDVGCGVPPYPTYGVEHFTAV